MRWGKHLDVSDDMRRAQLILSENSRLAVSILSSFVCIKTSAKLCERFVGDFWYFYRTL